MSKGLKSAPDTSNLDVDYVISYKYASSGIVYTFQAAPIESQQPMLTKACPVSDQTQAITQFESLIKALTAAGLDTEVRAGEDYSLLVFIREASPDHLNGEVYRSRCVVSRLPFVAPNPLTVL
jgi:anoctamin-10